MSDAHLAETVGVSNCCGCGSGLLARDRFCRRCGTRQSKPLEPSSHHADYSLKTETSAERSHSTSPYNTSPLEEAGAKTGSYRPVSGPLVNAVISGIASGNTGGLRSGLARRAMLALVLVPLWVMIVLLSPFDAYAAARSISRNGDLQFRSKADNAEDRLRGLQVAR